METARKPGFCPRDRHQYSVHRLSSVAIIQLNIALPPRLLAANFPWPWLTYWDVGWPFLSLFFRRHHIRTLLWWWHICCGVAQQPQPRVFLKNHACTCCAFHQQRPICLLPNSDVIGGSWASSSNRRDCHLYPFPMAAVDFDIFMLVLREFFLLCLEFGPRVSSLRSSQRLCSYLLQI